MREFERVLNRMTEDDWSKFNNELAQMKEQKTGLYAYAIWNENSDTTSKVSNKVSEGVSGSKRVEVVELENKILNSEVNYNSGSIVGVKNNGETYSEVSRSDNLSLIHI